MRGVNPGEVWMVDLGMAAKVRPALLLTGEPAADELDLISVLLHTTSLRGNPWEINMPKAVLETRRVYKTSKFEKYKGAA